MAKIYGETHFRHHRYPATDASIEVSCFDAGDGASDEYQRYAVVVVHTGVARLQFYARHGELRALAAHMLAAANDLDSGGGAVDDLPPQSAASQARAWQRMADVLWEVMPDWDELSDSGIESAEKAIRKLASMSKEAA